jgi:O-antigen/teichoic acid export membrane protein
VVVTEQRLTQTRRLDAERTWMRRLGLAWVVAISSLILFQPATSPAPQPLWATILVYTFLVGLGAIAVGIAKRHRWVFGVSGATGVLGMGLGYACLATDHHLGAWWMVEMGTFAALTVLSIAAAERSHHRST